MKDLNYYCNRFARLRVDRSRGQAPHKPILLLAIIELIDQRLVTRNQICLSPELIAAFLKYWSQLGSETHRSEIALPFFHLQSDGFWHLQAKPGFELVLSSRIKLKTIASINTAIEYAFLDEELFALLLDPSSRSMLLRVLIDVWFSNRAEQAEQLFQVDSFAEYQAKMKAKGGQVFTLESLQDEAEVVVRDAAFRKVVTSVYEYRCAFCRLQAINARGQNIVDGAHVKPFSKFYDDRIDNGLSLCKNHHWAFDQGWFAVDDNYQIIVAAGLREESPHARPMMEFQGEPIFTPPQGRYQPRIEALQWHRSNVFLDPIR